MVNATNSTELHTYLKNSELTLWWYTPTVYALRRPRQAASIHLQEKAKSEKTFITYVPVY